jgi:HEAT repeat protein/diketogulonate reductase-like aldo/keto reductase
MPVIRSLPVRLHVSRSRLERGSSDPRVDLLGADAALREAACEAIELDAIGVHALREALLLDTHASVRRAAAMRLAQIDDLDLSALAIAWLVEALADRFPSVRDSACHALARLAGPQPIREDRHTPAFALARRMSDDPVWWVRRAAARALAVVVDDPRQAIAALMPGLSDPFWRVRHAVVQALALVVANVDESARESVQRDLVGLGERLDDEVARAAIIYLAREWPIGDDFPALAGSVGDPAGIELDDPDPAVVTARLLSSRQRDPAALIPLLAESHEPLRREAARRLAGLPEPERLRPALAWLEDPRVPNAPASVARLLDRLGERAASLAEYALAGSRPGAIAWAARWVAEHPADALHERMLEHAEHADRRVRVAVAEACGVLLAREGDRSLRDRLVARLLDDELDVRDVAAAGLLAAGVPGSSLLAHLDRISPAVRARVIARLPLAEIDDGSLRRYAEDDDGRVRAAAIAGLVERGSIDSNAAHDRDPRVRAAAITPVTAAAHLDDDDASVRRAAARALIRQRGDTGLHALAIRSQSGDDPWIRAQMLTLLDGDGLEDDAIATLLLATRDHAAMVRAAAADRLSHLAQLPDRLTALLADDRRSPELRMAAWTHRMLASPIDPVLALAELDVALAPETNPALVEHLHAMTIAFGRDWIAPTIEPSMSVSPRAPREITSVVRRPLGSTGIELAPLIVSGAFGLTPGSLAFAVEHGVDTFFWEPRYANLGRFLRQRSRSSLQVIAGSFHADRAGIEADVELARRRLERETIDVFLLFWARSPARLGGESLDVLRELQQRGLIRSFGFSTHDRAIACEAIATGDWPVVMTRHSAAHLGAEHELFPQAHAAGVGVLSFSALCYGRMLRGTSVFEQGAEAVDCYRYSLAQPGVSACISAPRRHRELVENLGALEDPSLDPDLFAALQAHGREVHADNKRFDRLVRRGGSAPLREAILDLFERAGEPDDPQPELAH